MSSAVLKSISRERIVRAHREWPLSAATSRGRQDANKRERLPFMSSTQRLSEAGAYSLLGRDHGKDDALSAGQQIAQVLKREGVVYQILI